MAEFIELHPASFFDCPNCGAENFIRHVVLDDNGTLDPNMPVTTEMDGDGKEKIYEIPQAVACSQCKAVYPTEDYREVFERDAEDNSSEGGEEPDTEE